MHLGTLSALIVALAGNFWGGATTHTTGASYQSNIHSTALYSILAQTATTPTVSTAITPTAIVTSTGVVTGSTSLTATVTTTTTTSTTPSVPPSTAVPLPTVGPQASLQINPFDWHYLTSTPTNPKLGPFAWIFLVLMAALIGVGIYFLRIRGPQWKVANPVLFRATNRFAPALLWVGALGIILLIFRIIPLDFFNLRFWLWVDFLALLGVAGWIIYWYRTGYPKEMAKFTKTQKARQYMPGSRGKVASRSTPIATPQAKGAQQPRAGGTGKPAPAPSSKPSQQGSKNRKRK